jgi:hypothetical protein
LKFREIAQVHVALSIDVEGPTAVAQASRERAGRAIRKKGVILQI